MPRRPASVTQADISRAIRSAKAAGLPVVRVCFPGGTAIEIATQGEPKGQAEVEVTPAAESKVA